MYDRYSTIGYVLQGRFAVRAPSFTVAFTEEDEIWGNLCDIFTNLKH